MRLALYAHLQRLSPRFYARTRLGDIVSRINNDIGEIQRVAAEAALAWVGNVLFLVGSLVMLAWLDWRLALVALAAMPLSLWALVCYRRRLERRVAEAAAAQRRHRQLPDRDAAGRRRWSWRRTRRRARVARFRGAQRRLHRRADGDAAASPTSPAACPGVICRWAASRCSSTAGCASSTARSRWARSSRSSPIRCGCCRRCRR